MEPKSAISLRGVWRLALDAADAGVAGRWFARRIEGGDVELPGSVTAQGWGEPAASDSPWTGTIFDRSYFTAPEYAPFRAPAPVKLPFWLTPERVFVGPAWYQREVEIPAAWIGQRVVLWLERPHWCTRVWLGEREIGSGDSLSTPHEFDLGVMAAAGSHLLTMRIDNRLAVEVGENAHSVSDHTQGNWNGVVGAIELRVTGSVWIDDVQVYPSVATRCVRVRGRVGALPDAKRPSAVEVEVRWHASNTTCSERLEVKSLPLSIAREGGFAGEIALGEDAALWDEFSPVLHTLVVRLPGGANGVRREGGRGERRVRFGLREVRREGRRLLLNGRPLFLRGTLDCAVFPRTGFPPTDVAEWRRILATIKEHGLNHVRFHSWCPPEAAFEAGDELGVYFQVEAATWPNSVAVLAFDSPRGIGDGDAVDAWTLAEGKRILRAYGNHPSFLFFAAGNEPGGPHHREYLARWVEAMRTIDARHLYTGAAGWPELAENDFHVLPEPRAHQWGDGLASRLNATPPATAVDYRASVERRSAPVISHEIGQWCAYPALETAAKHVGPLRARSFEIFATWLRERGLAERYAAFAHAAGRLQVICYKEEIEAQLRTPGLTGFQLLGLQDFPGQGTAPVGVLDHFWEPKPYVSAAEFRRFCAPTVLLARLARRVFVAGETLEAVIEIAHLGAQPLVGAAVSWRVVDDSGGERARGVLPTRDVPVGNGIGLGEIRVAIGDVAVAGKWRLVVRCAGADIENEWDVWIYPREVDTTAPRSVRVVQSLDDATAQALRDGACVVLSGGRERARGDQRGRVELGFTPIFWNTACTQRQAPHTLGVVCDPAHPALAGFPTDAHSNWQWWYLLQQAGVLLLDSLPRDLRPVVEVIDDWYAARRLGLVFEVRVGRGRLLVCSIDLETGVATNPALRQLRASLLSYAAGERFQPSVEVSAERVQALFV